MSDLPSTSLDLAPQQTAPLSRAAAGLLAVLFLLLAAGAAVVAHDFRLHLNPDGVAYIQSARYLLDGEWNLVINGTWGPMLSWLIAPFLAAGMHPVAAGHAAMALSALWFWAGCLAVLLRFRISNAGVVLGAAAAAVAAISWSMRNSGITPDLLLAGWMALGTTALTAPGWPGKVPRAVLAGALFALAFLAKPVALPVSCVLIALIAILNGLTGTAPWRQTGKAALITYAAFFLVAAPWITALSIKYERLTYTTSARKEFLLTAPGYKWDYDPVFFSIHTPEAGRVSAFEDQAKIPYVNLWAQMTPGQRLRTWLASLYHNGRTLFSQLRGFDALGLGLAALVFAFAFHRPWLKNLAVHRWRWATVPAACLTGVYLPAGVCAERYLLPVFPFLLAAALALAAHLTAKSQGGHNASRCFALALVALAFLAPPTDVVRAAYPTAEGSPGHGAPAYELAERFERAGLRGPIVGTGPYQTGLYLAFLLEEAWHGDDPQESPGVFAQSGAQFLVLHRDVRPQYLAEFDAHPAFENLDHLLFESPEQAAQHPAKVYRITPPSPKR